MRRWLWRSLLVLLGVMVLFAGVGGYKTFALACEGSLEGYHYLSTVRTQIAPPPTATASPSPTATRAATATVPPTQTRQPTPTSSQPTPAPVPAAPPATPSPTVTPTTTPTPSPTATNTPAPAPTATPGEQPLPLDADRLPPFVRVAGYTAIGLLLWVKQSDPVAYPGHVVLAHGLDAAGCGEDAVRIQWLKAGLHASGEGHPERVARALAESARDRDDLLQLQRIVDDWAGRERRSVAMRRVRAAFSSLVAERVGPDAGSR